MEAGPVHIPVLVDEILGCLCPRAGETFVDCTAGLGGHAAVVAPRVQPGGLIVLNDLDRGNLALAAKRVRSQSPGAAVVEAGGNFVQIAREVERTGRRADMVLADLGFASCQMDDGSRGFSFQRDGPLDMRLDRSQGPTAADLVASLPEDELTRILREFGEERAARAIARKLVAARRVGSIETTAQFAEIVRSVVRPTGRIDPATRSFQALRIAVNDELGALEGLLAAIVRGARTQGSGWLAAGARIAIVSFHSLEDRLVKRSFRAMVTDGVAEHVGPQPASASSTEAGRNPRSRSAKLRAIRCVPPASGGAGSG